MFEAYLTAGMPSCGRCLVTVIVEEFFVRGGGRGMVCSCIHGTTATYVLLSKIFQIFSQRTLVKIIFNKFDSCVSVFDFS